MNKADQGNAPHSEPVDTGPSAGEPTIRAARKTDVAALVELRVLFLAEVARLESNVRLLPDVRSRTEHAMPVWVFQEGRILLVAEGEVDGPTSDEGAATLPLVGYAMGQVKVWPPVLSHLRVGEVTECFVHPQARGRGLGKALVDKLTTILEGRDAEVLRASASLANEAATGRLEAAGYSPVYKVWSRRLDTR